MTFNVETETMFVTFPLWCYVLLDVLWRSKNNNVLNYEISSVNYKYMHIIIKSIK